MSSKKAKRAKKLQKKQEAQKTSVKAKSRNILLFALIAAAVGFILYSTSINYGLVYFDDQKHLIQYKTFNEDISNISETFTKPTFGILYRPVLSISYILDTNILGSQPSAYHTTNVILHAFCCFFVFVLLYKLKFEKFLALAATLFYAVSPILTPAIAWIPGRNDPLLTLFALLTIITFISWVEADKSKKGMYLILHLIFFMISIFTKETALLQPVLLVLYLMLVRKENPMKSGNYLVYAAWAILIVIFLLMRSSALEGLKASGEVGIGAFFANIPAFFAIAGKIFLPVKMNGCAQFDDFSTYTGVAATLVMFALAFLAKKEFRHNAFFGLIWYFLFLAPTFAVLFTQADFDYLEHRAYLPLIGVLILILSTLLSYKISGKGQKFAIVAGILIVVFGVRAYAYLGNFEGREEFWSHSKKVYPEKAVGYVNIAKLRYEQQKLDEAEENYLEAEKIDPDNIGMNVDMAALYYIKKDYAKSEKYGLKAIELDPSNVTAANNLGAIYAVGGDWQKAEKYFEIVNKREHYNHDWYYNLGLAYLQNKKYEKAIGPFERALKILPNLPKVYLPLFQAYSAMGNAQMAGNTLERAVTLYPTDPKFNTQLIKFYLDTDNKEIAKRHANAYMAKGGKLNQNLLKRL
jgi:tetratricopeptide (TPR) repeat protein